MRRTASFTVELPLAEARPLFTAEGERRWVDGWDPVYPDPARQEGDGAVFVTHDTVWVMVDAETDRVRYARIVPGADAGTVEVRLEKVDATTTSVAVTYDLTALGPEGEAHLERFVAHYDEHIAGWGRAIAGSISEAS